MPKIVLELTEQEAELLAKILEVECSWASAPYEVYSPEDAKLLTSVQNKLKEHFGTQLWLIFGLLEQIKLVKNEIKVSKII